MRVLVVGRGGREHALAWRLKRSPSVTQVDSAPGNPGTARVGRRFPVAAEDVAGIVELARRERYDLVVVGPERPLTLGLADALSAAGIPVFGCTRAAAEIEGSKGYAKALLVRAGVPQGRYRSFGIDGASAGSIDRSAATDFARALAVESGRVVIKADGLASGKGVEIVEADGVDGAMERLAGGPIVVEEFLVGREASCLALVDGDRVVALPPCEDHKTILDGDRGPMTGGMGVISPTPVVDDALLERIEREVLRPTAEAMVDDGRPFHGLLYAGLMVTASGPKVLEFNCRFGDPEAEALMVRWQSDLGEALLAVAEGRATSPTFWKVASCTVVLAARGYPGEPERGAPISGIEAAESTGAVVFHSGTRADGATLLTDGGRVLAVTATGADGTAARERAYRAADLIHFDGVQLRRDVGGR